MVVPDHYLKKYSRNPIQTGFAHLLDECSEFYLPTNDWNWWFPTGVWKIIYTIQFKLGIYTSWVIVHQWFTFWPCWSHLCSLVASKMKLGEHGRLRSCVHLFGECSEFIRFWATLANFDPPGPQDDWKWWLPTVIWTSTIMSNNDYSSYFKHGALAGKRTVRKCFYFFYQIGLI